MLEIPVPDVLEAGWLKQILLLKSQANQEANGNYILASVGAVVYPKFKKPLALLLSHRKTSKNKLPHHSVEQPALLCVMCSI